MTHANKAHLPVSNISNISNIGDTTHRVSRADMAHSLSRSHLIATLTNKAHLPVSNISNVSNIGDMVSKIGDMVLSRDCHPHQQTSFACHVSNVSNIGDMVSNIGDMTPTHLTFLEEFLKSKLSVKPNNHSAK